MPLINSLYIPVYNEFILITLKYQIRTRYRQMLNDSDTFLHKVFSLSVAWWVKSCVVRVLYTVYVCNINMFYCFWFIVQKKSAETFFYLRFFPSLRDSHSQTLTEAVLLLHAGSFQRNLRVWRGSRPTGTVISGNTHSLTNCFPRFQGRLNAGLCLWHTHVTHVTHSELKLHTGKADTKQPCVWGSDCFRTTGWPEWEIKYMSTHWY